MWCPRCDQGHVIKAKIKKTNEEIHICEECDATWINDQVVEKSTFQDFSKIMNERQLSPFWTELKIEKSES